MNLETLNLIIKIAFFIIIGFLGIIALLTAYVFIRYGRTPGITILSSLVFAGVFFLGILSAYLTLQQLF